MGLLSLVFGCLLVTIGGGSLGLLLAPLHLRVPKTGGLMGIGDVTAPFHAKKIADNLLRELGGVLREQPLNWTTVGEYGRLKVEARRVPDIAESDILVARGRGTIPSAVAADALAFLASEEGLQVAFDTAWVSEDGRAPTVEGFDNWRGATNAAATLRVVETIAKLPGGLAPRALVALVGYDAANGILVTKSVIHRQRAEVKNRVRGMITFHARVTQKGDDAVVEVVRYLDAAGDIPPVLVNYVNCKRSLPRLFSELHERFSGLKETTAPRRTKAEEAARIFENEAAKAASTATRKKARSDATIVDSNRDALAGRARVDGDYESVDGANAEARTKPAGLDDLQARNRGALEARARVEDEAALEAAYGPVGAERRLRRWVQGRLSGGLNVLPKSAP